MFILKKVIILFGQFEKYMLFCTRPTYTGKRANGSDLWIMFPQIPISFFVSRFFD